MHYGALIEDRYLEQIIAALGQTQSRWISVRILLQQLEKMLSKKCKCVHSSNIKCLSKCSYKP